MPPPPWKDYDQSLLSDQHWTQIQQIVPHPDVLTFDTRKFVEIVLWCVQTGCRWRYLGSKYPECRLNNVHRRYARWCRNRVWERIFGVLESDPAFLCTLWKAE
jgi:transposase